MTSVSSDLTEAVPGIIVSLPEASIYSVVDVRDVARPGFNAMDFVLYCARRGRVELDGRAYTLLVSPMSGFYQSPAGAQNPGRTQMRISYVDTPERMSLVPKLFAELFTRYESGRSSTIPS